MALDHPQPTSGRKSDRTRESILVAARTAFARKGFSGVTIRDITELAPVPRANFYYYFPGKTELFIELGTETYREAFAVVESLAELGRPPTRPALEHWVGEYFDYLDRNGAFVIRSAEDMPPDDDFRAAVNRSHRRTAAALGAGIAKIASTPTESDPVATGLVVMAMLERSWSMVRHHETPWTTREDVRAAITEVLWRLALPGQ
jgi:AcrR family transcriptional regulator